MPRTHKPLPPSPPAPPETWQSLVRRAVSASRRIAVIGVGRPGQGDDAAGTVCAKALRAAVRGRDRSRLKIFVAGEAPEASTGAVRRFSPAVVILLDAALGRKKPGTVFSVAADAIADEGLSTHNISLKYLIAYLEKTLPCRVIVLGIQPETIAPGIALSEPVRKAVARVVGVFESALEGRFARPGSAGRRRTLKSSSASGRTSS